MNTSQQAINGMDDLARRIGEDLCKAHPEVSLEMVRTRHAEYPTVSMMEPRKMKQIFAYTITRVFISFNKELETEQLRSMVEMLYQDIMVEREVYLRSITIEEIHRALNRAKSRGELFPTESSIFEAIYKYYNDFSIPTSARLAGRVLTFQNN